MKMHGENKHDKKIEKEKKKEQMKAGVQQYYGGCAEIKGLKLGLKTVWNTWV